MTERSCTLPPPASPPHVTRSSFAPGVSLNRGCTVGASRALALDCLNSDMLAIPSPFQGRECEVRRVLRAGQVLDASDLPSTVSNKKDRAEGGTSRPFRNIVPV